MAGKRGSDKTVRHESGWDFEAELAPPVVLTNKPEAEAEPEQVEADASDDGLADDEILIAVETLGAQDGEVETPPAAAPERRKRSVKPGGGSPAARQPAEQGPAGLASYNAFRAETHRLARARDYRAIADLHEAALEKAPWAAADDVNAALLLDLARLYRDRLPDRARAQQTFERLVAHRAGHEEAIKFLAEIYEGQGNMQALHDLYAHAVDEEWGPERRLELTRNAARIALENLRDPKLAARDWERLLELGDLDAQVTVELSRVYREAGRWSDLGEFLQNRAGACSGTTRVAILREAVEAFLAGASDAERSEVLIQQILAESPDDPVALASLATLASKREQWEELANIARRAMPDVPSAARLDVLRLVADLLTRAGEHDRAAVAYERILQLAPNDKTAVAAREEQLRRKGDHEGLVAFLVGRAVRTRAAADKARLIAKAAEVAEQFLDDAPGAAGLWQRCVAAAPDSAAAYDALVALYDRLNDASGITQALEGLARVTREPKARAKVLRRLGDHYAYRADNDNEAQRCWLEVTSVTPEDTSVQRELNGIHRRRGDFAALDLALTRQLWRTIQPEQAIELAREIAQNLDENLAQPERTVRAWMHVLDLAPGEPQALQTLSEKLARRRESTEVHGWLETRLTNARTHDDRAAQIEIGLQIASDWEQRGERHAAIAAYERVRSWAPDHDAALQALVRLYGGQEPHAAASVLEIASAQSTDPVQSMHVLARSLPLVAGEAHRARFLLLRRLLRLHADSDLEHVVASGSAAGAWPEVAALYEYLARMAPDMAQRHEFGLKLAQVCEAQLGNSARAYVALQSLGLKPMSDEDCAALERLAEATGRWEDLLAVLDVTVQQGASPDRAHAVLLRRAEICDKKLNDPRRAFLELQRFIEGRGQGDLTPAENEILARMRELATGHNLMPELAAVYDSLWDLAATEEQRVRFAREREAILREHLNDATGALQQSLLILRMLPTDEAIAQEVLAAAERLNQWDRAVPVLEGVWRSIGDDPGRLAMLARLYEEKCGNALRAIELLAEAVRLQPANTEIQGSLERLGDRAGQWARVVQALRLAAAAASGTERGLELARKVAALYAEKLGDQAASREIHRWILQVWPGELASLQVVIDAHRSAGEHADLRTALEQWVERTTEPERHIAAWLEIGRLCRDHLKDPAGALLSFSHVIEIDPTNDEAAEAMKALGDVSLAPALRRKRARVELARASGARKVELLAELARLEQEMGDHDAAIATLRDMMAVDGGREAAFEPLSALLRESASWAELATLLEETAGLQPSDEAKLRRLREALEVTERHLDDPERGERLLRQVLALARDDHDASVKLARLLRNAHRFEELVQELRTRLATVQQPSTAFWMRRELVRILDGGLQRSSDAEALLRESVQHGASEATDALWLAMLAARRGDHNAYIEQRRKHSAKLPKLIGALVLCHLAEHCDHTIKVKARVLALYREARALDGDNMLATDALRGLGRGVRTWRSTAALLPAPSEEALSDKERAAQLRILADGCREAEPAAALSWYERAAAVDPNDIASWDTIAAIALERGEHDYAFLASLEAAYAFERVHSPLESQPSEFAARLAATAEVARKSGHGTEAGEIGEIAFAIDAGVPSSALLVADARFQAGDTPGSTALYTHILGTMGERLTSEQRSEALFRRGSLSLAASDVDGAQADLREALQLRPLYPPALDAMAELLKKTGQPANAALHLLKALLVTRDTLARGAVCRRIGELFEADLARADEAGAWFELAVEAGTVDNGLKRRLLEHYRRTGRAQQALTALEDLIGATSEPAELADLWALKGSILAEADLDTAVEALDIALSYDPGHSLALASLRAVLEHRGDYEQLADMLDARTESGSFDQRVDALGSLVRICFEILGDVARGEQYLVKLVELAPSRDSFEDLLRIVEADPARHGERLALISRILGAGPPYTERLIEAAHIIYDSGDKHWTWAVLSAVLGAAPVEVWTKNVLSELRKQYERFDSITLLKPFVPASVGALPEPTPLTAALSDLCARLTLTSDDGTLPTVDPRTGPGKLFERVVENLGFPAKLLRSGDAAPALIVLAGEIPTFAIRTDVLSAPPGELAYLYTAGMMLARKECVALASAPVEMRHLLIPAVAAASMNGESQNEDAEIAALASRILEVLSADDLKAWRAYLNDVSRTAAAAAVLFDAVDRAAARVALLAAGDLRTSTRAMARFTQDNKRPPGVARLDEFEHFFSSMPVAPLFEFALSDQFGKLLAASG